MHFGANPEFQIAQQVPEDDTLSINGKIRNEQNRH
jgi:hypothetical protein